MNRCWSRSLLMMGNSPRSHLHSADSPIGLDIEGGERESSGIDFDFDDFDMDKEY